MNNIRKAVEKTWARKFSVSNRLHKPEQFIVCADDESLVPKGPRLLLLARSLDRGGAQRQLVTLACGLRARGWDVSVARFYAGDRWEEELRRADVTLHDLRKYGRWDVLAFLFQLGRLLRKERPTILHGYLSTPNLLTILLRPLLPGTRIVWGIRSSNMDLSRYDWLARLTFFLTCKIARLADLIIVNSHAGKDYHIAHGYPEHKMLVIPNGIDTERFRFDAAGRQRLRAEWDVPTKSVLIGLVGRLDPMKDHPTFLRAAALLTQEDTRCRFVCVGDGPPEYANELRREAQAWGLTDWLVWAGGRNDMAAVYSAFDVACSSSFGEGFPNVVAEAMACGRPCVVTDVGDSATIVGNAGLIVPPRDPAALASALTMMLSMSLKERNELGTRALQCITNRFSKDQLLDATERGLFGEPAHRQEAT